MSFTEKDKDYLFGLLENILKCVYINTQSGPNTREKLRDEVMEFMIRFNIWDEKNE